MSSSAPQPKHTSSRRPLPASVLEDLHTIFTLSPSAPAEPESSNHTGKSIETPKATQTLHVLVSDWQGDVVWSRNQSVVITKFPGAPKRLDPWLRQRFLLELKSQEDEIRMKAERDKEFGLWCASGEECAGGSNSWSDLEGYMYDGRVVIEEAVIKITPEGGEERVE
ncbi:hypothetical protein B0T14DRAFT_493623 [Immersiella caudata]|uniref:Uncharacterized protein n=1 Tax=Immersiella caudata TaxID=314043 RepID=A0AA39X587_9PEZI|nr:hypothetical protein B0T14DRAFT_493623 [Immersiella caudata]